MIFSFRVLFCPWFVCIFHSPFLFIKDYLKTCFSHSRSSLPALLQFDTHQHPSTLMFEVSVLYLLVSLKAWIMCNFIYTPFTRNGFWRYVKRFWLRHCHYLLDPSIIHPFISQKNLISVEKHLQFIHFHANSLLIIQFMYSFSYWYLHCI